MRERQAHWRKEEPPRIYAGECQATLELGTTGWLARVLAPEQPPEYFVPSMTAYGGPIHEKATMCKALHDAYGKDNVVFVSEELFNRKVEEQADLDKEAKEHYTTGEDFEFLSADEDLP